MWFFILMLSVLRTASVTNTGCVEKDNESDIIHNYKTDRNSVLWAHSEKKSIEEHCNN